MTTTFIAQRSLAGLKASRSPYLPVHVRYIQQASSTVVQSPILLEAQISAPGVSCLSLNRPQSMNAISMKMLQQMHELLDSIPRDKSIRALIVRSSSPRIFCAGADLKERRSMSYEQISKFLYDLRSALSKLETLSIPTIAALDGHALGGGIELGLACDIRVAAESGLKIGLPETGLGIIPGAGGTQRLTRLIGPSRAKACIFTGTLLTPSEALNWGVVDYMASPDSSAFQRALTLAKEISARAPLAIQAAKKAISLGQDLPLEHALDMERECYDPLLDTKDRVEALNAFQEKRLPIFKGE